MATTKAAAAAISTTRKVLVRDRLFAGIALDLLFLNVVVAKAQASTSLETRPHHRILQTPLSRPRFPAFAL
jgi:hypothetical protein